MAADMNRIRIGILGCAKIARRSMAPAILQLKDRFELLAVASRDAEKAKDFAREFSCEAVTGYAALLARPDLDALYVPLPTGLHHEWVGPAERPFVRAIHDMGGSADDHRVRRQGGRRYDERAV